MVRRLLPVVLFCSAAWLAGGFVVTHARGELMAKICSHRAAAQISMLSDDPESTRDPEPDVPRLSYKEWLASKRPTASTTLERTDGMGADTSRPAEDTLSDSLNNADAPEESCMTRAEKFAKFRERQRQRALGAPVHVWSQGTDVEDPPDAKPHQPVPPTPEQAAAANALAEAMLSNTEMPDLYIEGKGGTLQSLEFGQDLDELAEGGKWT